MGLDMYLRGEKYFWTNWDEPSKNRREDDIEVNTLTVRLGYWRKHPNLHGYIVNTFAGGVDDCQRISLSPEQLRQIIKAVKERSLPSTQGFFFGRSASVEADGEELVAQEIAEDIAILEKAIAWVETEEKGVSRDVYYEASW
jgi:hypothetical protein